MSTPKAGPRLFTMYRRGDLSATHDSNQANAPDEPQFEGVVFSDGRCALRWLTPKGSVSVWDSFDDAMAIHGHPEYDSDLVWRKDPLDRVGIGYTLATGRLFCEIGVFHKYAEQLLGRPVMTHELGRAALWDELRKRYETLITEIGAA